MKKTILLSLFAVFCTCANAQVTSLVENFDVCDSISPGPGGSPKAYFPPNWYNYSVTGDQVWEGYSEYGFLNSACMEMNGYAAGSNYANEDWLITPQLTLSSYTNIYLNFYALYKFAGDSLHIMVSNNYTGTGSPTAATWHELAHPHTTMFDDTGALAFKKFQVNLTSYKSTPLYVGFKYTSSDTDGSRWNIDSVATSTIALGTYPTTGVKEISVAQLPVSVIGQATANEITVGYQAAEGQYTLVIFDLLGKKVYAQNITSNGSYEMLPVNNPGLATGMYVLKIGNENSYGVTKFVVQ